MYSRIILCTLSPLKKVELEEDERKEYGIPEGCECKIPDPKEGGKESCLRERYSADGCDKFFWGFLTNEAPVEYLLYEAHSLGEDVGAIYYLCSEKCSEKNLCAFSGDSLRSQSISAAQYFEESIEAYCAANGMCVPVFKAIKYDPGDPKASLNDVVEAIKTPSMIIDLDTTGGQRHAVNLMTLAIDVALAQSRKVDSGASKSNTDDDISNRATRLGNVVYSDITKKRVERGKEVVGVVSDQLETHGLVELVNAVDAFTRYGKVSALQEYFFGEEIYLGNDYSSEAMQRFCWAAQSFSDKLSLCDVTEIDDSVNEVLDALHDFEVHFKVFWGDYKLAQELVEDIENETAPSEADCIEVVKSKVTTRLNTRRGSLSEMKSRGDDEDNPVPWLEQIVEAENFEEMRSEIHQFRELMPTYISLGEILFNGMIPSIHARFVHGLEGENPDAKDRALQILEIIRWCIDRQMLQQALALYCEKAPQCFADLGLIEWVVEPEAGPSLNGDSAVNRIKQFYLNPTSNVKCINVDKFKRFTDNLWYLLLLDGRREPLGNSSVESQLARIVFPSEFVDTNYARVTVTGTGLLPVNLVLYSFIYDMRNMVMHSDERENKQTGLLNRFLETVGAGNERLVEELKDLKDDVDVSHVSSALRLAVSALEAADNSDAHKKYLLKEADDVGRYGILGEAMEALGRGDGGDFDNSRRVSALRNSLRQGERLVKQTGSGEPSGLDDAYRTAWKVFRGLPSIEIGESRYYIVNENDQRLPTRAELGLPPNGHDYNRRRRTRLGAICRSFSRGGNLSFKLMR